MTLAKWDPQSAMDVLALDTTAPEVLLYYWQEENRRNGLMPTLIANPAIPETLLMELAATSSREIVAILLRSSRVQESAGVIEALLSNPHLTLEEARTLRGEIVEAVAPPQADAGFEEFEVTPDTEAALQAFEQEHATEISAAEGKPFELAKEEDPAAGTAVEPAVAAGNEPVAPPKAEAAATAAPVQAGSLDEFDAAEQKRVTVLQKLGKMNVGQRIKLGFIGNKEERAILVRDTARLVQNAVLQSPKLTDAEVESFAGSKNLQENVFREIARQRRFVKLYPVVRNLVSNPKCPLDISLTLIKSLQVYDLKSLRHNKNVPDTIRKVAAKLYLEKASRGGEKKDIAPRATRGL